MMTRHDIDNAQQAWGDGIVAIAKAHSDGGDYEAVPEIMSKHCTPTGWETSCSSQRSPLLNFRPTFDEALSYFVASNNACPEDKASPSRDGQMSDLKDAGVILRETTALAMRSTFSQHLLRDEVKVEYTFGYVLDEMERCESMSTIRLCRRLFRRFLHQRDSPPWNSEGQDERQQAENTGE